MTLSVVLVDDEALTIQLLTHLINWQSLDLTLVGTASNGVEALEVMEETKPDIVITDINMPKQSGLDLIKQTKTASHQPAFILISAYSDFRYVQEAMKLGCHDYILKPIDEHELAQAITHVIEKILGERQIETMIEQHDQELKRLYLKNYLFSGQPIDLLAVRAEDYPVDFRHYLVLIIKLQYQSMEEFNKAGHMSQDHKQKVERTMSGVLGDTGHVIFDYHQEAWVCLISQVSPSEMGHLAKLIVQQLQEVSPLSFHACFSHVYHTLTDLNQAYEEAKLLTRYTMYLDTDTVLGFSYNMDSKAFKELNTESLLKELHDSIKQKSFQQAKKVLDDLFAVSKHINPEALETIYETCYQITTLIQSTLVAQDIENDETTRLLKTSYEEIKQLTDLKQLQAFMHQLLYVALYDHDHQDARYSRLVQDGIRVIKTKYQENLNLETICDEIAVSKNYFSYLFKREVGMNLWQYLTEYRLKKAKRLLLESELKSYEIAFQVGYDNPSYFSMVFKKYEGMTPNQYRQKNVIK
ncbi:response regulator [Halolactibacillus sp. JCM 19043]|uniref:response regulator n=1 Tax=Halolactibacillus sp. JCM 19043 TaxID=1460638 RepID=UPI00078484DA|nr:response regulator [Halolactibacillus sp. JCM 19043]